MKYLVWVLFFGALIYVWHDNRFVSDQISCGIGYLFGSVDADSLKDRPLEPYALPKGHCKASFPGMAHPPLPGHELLSTFTYPGTTCVMSDKEVTYYLTETAMPNRLPELVAVTQPQLATTAILGGSSSSGDNSPAAQSDEVRAQQVTEQVINDWAKDNGASFTGRVPVAIAGGRYNGREVTGHMKDPKNTFRLRFFTDYPNKRIIAIGIIGKPERVKSPSSSKFIQSLEMWQ